MADNKTKRGQPDRSKINMSEDYEVKYWAKELGVTPRRPAARRRQGRQRGRRGQKRTGRLASREGSAATPYHDGRARGGG